MKQLLWYRFPPLHQPQVRPHSYKHNCLFSYNQPFLGRHLQLRNWRRFILLQVSVPRKMKHIKQMPNCLFSYNQPFLVYDHAPWTRRSTNQTLLPISDIFSLNPLQKHPILNKCFAAQEKQSWLNQKRSWTIDIRTNLMRCVLLTCSFYAGVKFGKFHHKLLFALIHRCIYIGGVMRLESLIRDINDEMLKKIMENPKYELTEEEAKPTAQIVLCCIYLC